MQANVGRCCLALHVWFVRVALLVWGMRSVASKDVFEDERQQPLRALTDQGCLARLGATVQMLLSFA